MKCLACLRYRDTQGHETLHWTRQINRLGEHPQTSSHITINTKTTHTHKTHMPTQMGTKVKLKQYVRQKHVTKPHNGEEHWAKRGQKTLTRLTAWPRKST